MTPSAVLEATTDGPLTPAAAVAQAPHVRAQLLAFADRMGALVAETTAFAVEAVQSESGAEALPENYVADGIVAEFRGLDPEYGRLLSRLLLTSRAGTARTAQALTDLFVCVDRDRRR